MVYYAHRGNLIGSAPELENKPEYVDESIARGFSAEVDIRLVSGELYLGHDVPAYPVSTEWIENRKGDLLLHAKDAYTAQYLGLFDGWHYFCHSADPFALTSRRLIWLHDLTLPYMSTTILAAIHSDFTAKHVKPVCHGICSDFVQNARLHHENR